ncbi:Hypothetical predicted protein [Mytilus galloprovincialis]|uniref:Retrotransposon gag domain-containing protein n=1 Tax=Mytilus galloprovincialis TaxID=29158 RepID=A0A8B6FDR2_MYTGA|nr:Hypothetical predicted protein [Mytilus galloprovincialis]
MGRTRKTRNRSLSPAPSVSVVRTPISSTPHERRDLPEVKSQVTPSKFFGDVGEDFESWIKIFDRISRANRWSDGRKGEMLPAYLRGRAADYFEDLDSEIQNDFDTAVQKLKQRFCPKELERMYYSELFQRKQISGESVEDYGNAILKLARRAHGGVSFDEHDRLAMEHFLQELHPSLRRFVMMSDPQSFEQEFIVSATGQPLYITGIIECEISVNSEVSVHNIDVSDNEILIDEKEHLVNLDKTFCDISNDFQLVEDSANKSEDKEDNTGDDIISISDTLTFGDMNSSSHVVTEETIITIIID